jgi:hypothetical protein
MPSSSTPPPVVLESEPAVATEPAADSAFSAADAPPPAPTAAEETRRRGVGRRVLEWVRVLKHPRAQTLLTPTEREQLLVDLNRAVAEASDDVPLRETLDRLNHPYTD